MHDAYAGLNRLYLSMHTPAGAEGQDLGDPVMAKWISNHAVNGAAILDAGCGLGFEVLALHKGIPARATGKHFVVYGSDNSPDMLKDAKHTGVQAGVPESHYRVSSFADLVDVVEWREHMDVVVVNYAIYTQPLEDCDYDGYLADSLRGLSSVIRPGGHLAINLRDWAALKAADAAGTGHSGGATHLGRTYCYSYTWEFGPNRLHRTSLRMWEDGEFEHSTDIWFAEREIAEIVEMLREAGFKVVHSDKHGEGPYAFDTLIARKS